MKFTIRDCISRINQALNYPAISYEDVSHFFDQAIAELNTSLRIALPLVSEMKGEHTFKITDSEFVTVLSDPPTSNIITVAEIPDSPPTSDAEEVVYYNSQNVSNLDHCFYIWKNEQWLKTDTVYAVRSNSRDAYVATPVSYSYAIWLPTDVTHIEEFSITEYLTTDWIILFLIPYVCFKFSVRNGDNGALFSDEFTQGFQQLQTSYSVPNTVRLNKVAHLKPYTNIVKNNINNLSVTVPTRAITEDMRIPNGVRPVYGATLFDNGGWGI